MTKRKIRSKNTIHGHSGKTRSITYNTWAKMLSRCNNPYDDAFPNYGGRGIVVCESWQKDFRSFLADMGERPKDMTLDRIDVNGNYCKSNCRWATRSAQQLNRRNQNKFGLSGISQDSKTGAYVAKVHLNRKPVILKYTYDLNEAIKARLDWDKKHGSKT